jgi:hypothetical protein
MAHCGVGVAHGGGGWAWLIVGCGLAGLIVVLRWLIAGQAWLGGGRGSLWGAEWLIGGCGVAHCGVWRDSLGDVMWLIVAQGSRFESPWGGLFAKRQR